MADFPDRPGYSFVPGPPPEASRFLRNKGFRPAFSWQDVEPEEHAVAFTVAKATDMDVLKAIRDGVQEALDEGLPFEEFQKRLKPTLQEKGWWGYDGARDQTDGQIKPAKLGSPRRLKTIYRANMRSARAAGQWERIQRTKRALPYLTYRLGPSERHRPHHQDKENLTLSVDDPFWDAWMPPNGWGCKCWVRAVTVSEAESLGINDSPEVPRRDFENRRTGEIKSVPVGIDPGWERNPGKLRLRAAEKHLAGKLTGADPQVELAALRDIATSWRVRRIVAEGKSGVAPVTVLPDEFRSELRTDARHVLVSKDTATKQLDRHPDVKPETYAKLADLLATAEVRTNGSTHLTFIERVTELPTIAVIKVTQDGSELYLQTLYENGARRYLERLRRDTELVR